MWNKRSLSGCDCDCVSRNFDFSTSDLHKNFGRFQCNLKACSKRGEELHSRPIRVLHSLERAGQTRSTFVSSVHSLRFAGELHSQRRGLERAPFTENCSAKHADRIASGGVFVTSACSSGRPFPCQYYFLWSELRCAVSLLKSQVCDEPNQDEGSIRGVNLPGAWAAQWRG